MCHGSLRINWSGKPRQVRYNEVWAPWTVIRIEKGCIFCWKSLFNGSMKGQEEFGQDFSFWHHKKTSKSKACWNVVPSWLKKVGGTLISDTSCNAPWWVSIRKVTGTSIAASRFSTFPILTLEKFPILDRSVLKFFHEHRLPVKWFWVKIAVKC